VEGYALDRVAEGSWALQPVHQNMRKSFWIRQLQVADAARASLGLPVVENIVTDTPLEVSNFILF
ncbi:hypothetical protein A2U01_0069252, partial [Trifolium medium]|nr:hypothetical protein [Trifolium medium]